MPVELGRQSFRLEVGLESVLIVAAEDGDVEALGVETVALDEQLPGPGDGLAL
ncbi:MAG: hypothetical protein R3F20_06150 [Planctomycetota bacterium]